MGRYAPSSEFFKIVCVNEVLLVHFDIILNNLIVLGGTCPSAPMATPVTVSVPDYDFGGPGALREKKQGLSLQIWKFPIVFHHMFL